VVVTVEAERLGVGAKRLGDRPRADPLAPAGVQCLQARVVVPGQDRRQALAVALLVDAPLQLRPALGGHVDERAAARQRAGVEVDELADAPGATVGDTVITLPA
jgi:hypothetical protein